jgi:hypothetical protein
MVSAARWKEADFRRNITWNLPTRERLARVQPTDWDGTGTTKRGTWGKGKRYATITQLWDEMADMAAWQERTFGARTAWTGKLHATAGRGAAGVATWGGAIGFARDVWTTNILYDEVARRKVALHELFHMVSGRGARHTPAQYVASRGWEEGVVERCAQVWERDATIAAGKPWHGKPAYTTYKEYTQPLETIRGVLGMDERDYYTRLIQHDLTERRTLVRTWVDDALKDGRITQDQAQEAVRQFTKLGV